MRRRTDVLSAVRLSRDKHPPSNVWTVEIKCSSLMNGAGLNSRENCFLAPHPHEIWPIYKKPHWKSKKVKIYFTENQLFFFFFNL